tara:strand:- start:919 stop:1083 length:165 start_codon:yes stop_codon:yes gene_type:complete
VLIGRAAENVGFHHKLKSREVFLRDCHIWFSGHSGICDLAGKTTIFKLEHIALI